MPFRKGNFVIMKVDLETSNSYTEVMTVINTLPTIDRTKIPDKLLNIIKENSNYSKTSLVYPEVWKDFKILGWYGRINSFQRVLEGPSN